MSLLLSKLNNRFLPPLIMRIRLAFSMHISRHCVFLCLSYSYPSTKLCVESLVWEGTHWSYLLKSELTARDWQWPQMKKPSARSNSLPNKTLGKEACIIPGTWAAHLGKMMNQEEAEPARFPARFSNWSAPSQRWWPQCSWQPASSRSNLRKWKDKGALTLWVTPSRESRDIALVK